MPPKQKWEPGTIDSDVQLKELCSAEQSFGESQPPIDTNCGLKLISLLDNSNRSVQ